MPNEWICAREKIGVDASRCIVIEDSLVGLRAAKEAHMKCIITYCESTDKVDFYKEGADAKIPNLGKVGLKDILGPLRANPHAEVLEGLRDAGKVSAPAAAAPVAAAPKAAAPAAAAPKAAAPAAAAPKAAFDAVEQTAIGDLKRRTSTLHESNEASLKQPSRPAAPARQLSWYPHAMILKPKLT